MITRLPLGISRGTAPSRSHFSLWLGSNGISPKEALSSAVGASFPALHSVPHTGSVYVQNRVDISMMVICCASDITCYGRTLGLSNAALHMKQDRYRPLNLGLRLTCSSLRGRPSLEAPLHTFIMRPWHGPQAPVLLNAVVQRPPEPDARLRLGIKKCPVLVRTHFPPDKCLLEYVHALQEINVYV